MADTSFTIDQTNAAACTDGGSVADYIALMKPRVMSLVVFTALVGMVAAPVHVHPVIGFIALVCVAVGAGASGALNMWYDADIDARMQRTQSRPIPRGKITADEALTFGMVLSIGSVLTLGLLVNPVAGALLALTIAFYMVIYTMWLKRRTPMNIVIGGAAGAFPPMVGWAAASGSVTLDSVLLFAIIFFWTPPHFWALALYRCRDYERVGVPMLPVVAGLAETRRQIVIYTAILLPFVMAPGFTGLGGIAYMVTATGLSAVFGWLVYKVWLVREGRQADVEAKRLFLFSIFYLFALFAVLLVEHSVSAWLT